VASDRQLQDRIIEGQYAALDRLEAKNFGRTLLSFVDQVLAVPRQPHPEVAFDFWDQLQRREELDELRRHRPAAFRASPEGR
jgi:5'-3' exonuclease